MEIKIKSNNIISSRKEMTKRDLIETLLIILNKITEYTDTLEQRTPSIFDKNISQQQELDMEDLSTCSSSNEENFIINNSDKKDNYTLTDFFYFWIDKLDFDENLLLLTMMNIDKLLSKEFILIEDNIKNVLFTCMIITQKNYEDVNYTNKDYAKILNVSVEDLLNMELVFLGYIDFSLYISQEDFDEYKLKIQKFWKKTLSFLTFS